MIRFLLNFQQASCRTGGYVWTRERRAHCQPFGFNAALAGRGSRYGMISRIEVGTISRPAPQSLARFRQTRSG